MSEGRPALENVAVPISTAARRPNSTSQPRRSVGRILGLLEVVVSFVPERPAAAETTALEEPLTGRAPTRDRRGARSRDRRTGAARCATGPAPAAGGSRFETPSPRPDRDRAAAAASGDRRANPRLPLRRRTA